ncbi:MAG TPA: ABC transporter permease [bacterium]|nr:ABC transporter permease [bacterium]
MSNAAAATANASDDGARAMPGFLYSVWVIFQLESLKILKDPAEIISRSVQPALWLLLFGQAFNHAAAVDTGGVPYLAYLTPGILAQAITFVSIFNGLSIIWEKDMGLMQKVLSTPITRTALVLGKMLSASTRSFFQLLVVTALALCLGLRFEWTILRVLGLLALMVLGSAFFTGLSMILASIVRTRERMMGIGQLATMPLFFASSALYPVQAMPAWLRAFAMVNPMSFLVNGLRGLMLDPAYMGFGVDAGVLLALSLAALAIATWRYPKLLL